MGKGLTETSVPFLLKLKQSTMLNRPSQQSTNCNGINDKHSLLLKGIPSFGQSFNLGALCFWLILI